MNKVRTRSRQLDHKVYSNIEPHVARKWCTESFGEQWNAMDNRIGSWTCFWTGTGPERIHGKYVYRFAEEQDAVWFKLRWA